MFLSDPSKTWAIDVTYWEDFPRLVSAPGHVWPLCIFTPCIELEDWRSTSTALHLLHCFVVHCTSYTCIHSLHRIGGAALRFVLHSFCIVFHRIALSCITITCVMFCIALHCFVVHCTSYTCIHSLHRTGGQQHCALYCFAFHCIAYCFALPLLAQCFALHCIALHGFAMLCFALCCTALHCFALPCTALNCFSWFQWVFTHFNNRFHSLQKFSHKNQWVVLLWPNIESNCGVSCILLPKSIWETIWPK